MKNQIKVFTYGPIFYLILLLGKLVMCENHVI